MTSSIFRTVATGAVALLAVSLMGCTAATPSEPATSSSDVAAAAMTCGAAAVILANLQNADSDRGAGRIDEAEWVAATDLAKTDFDGIRRFTEWGLEGEVQAITDYLTTSSPQPSGAAFDSTSDEFGALLNDLRAACESNGTPISTFATSGG